MPSWLAHVGVRRHSHGPLTRYAKLRFAHAQGMPVMFSSPPRVSDPVMHHGTCVTHVPWSMPGSLTFPAFPVHARPAFYISGKRPITSMCVFAGKEATSDASLLVIKGLPHETPWLRRTCKKWVLCRHMVSQGHTQFTIATRRTNAARKQSNQ